MVKRYIEVEDEETGEIYMQENPEWTKEYIKKMYNFFLNESKIPKEYYDIDESNYLGDKTYSDFKKCMAYGSYCTDPDLHDVNLYLTGDNSSGKTTIACMVGKKFILSGYRVRFILAGALMDHLMKNQGFNRDEIASRELSKLSQADLVIIDDAFDPQKSLKWRGESGRYNVLEFDNFVRTLLSNDIRLIITSNKTITEIFSEYGKSLHNLIKRNFVPYEFNDSVEVTVQNSKVEKLEKFVKE